MAEILSYSQLDPVLSLGSGEVDIIQAEVPALLVGRTVNTLNIPSEIAVVSITRSNKAFLPTLGTVFEAGDRIRLAMAATAMSRLNAMLQPA